jgi:uncharacterized protein YacL (UPF0231 family)
MGFLNDRLTAKLGDHTIDIKADNHVLRGLIYKLFVDDEELDEAQNFLKIPGERTLEARITLDGAERHIVVEVKQRMLRTEFSLLVDGEEIPTKVIV